LDGARDTVAAGIVSSLQPQNIRLRRAIQNIEQASIHKDYPLLFDPQTAGGLLAGIPKANAEACLRELKQLGYHHASIVGKINVQEEHAAPIKIIC
jgi:selenide,water dikinase